MSMKKLCILIDNGHGMETAGKRSPDSRLLEWKWNREFASLLHARLCSEGVCSNLIVTEEKDVSLSNRCLRANTIAKNFKSRDIDTLFISIHVNAAGEGGWSNASGVGAYVYRDGSEKSKALGKIYMAQAKKMGLSGNRSIPEEGYWPCGFYVCKNTNMPAVLIENDFMTNQKSVEFLLSKEGKEKLIEWHLNSILEYMKKYNYI